MLQAHIERRLHYSLRSVIEHGALTTHKNSAAHWVGTESRTSVEASCAEAALGEFDAKPGEHIDVHAWYLAPSSFAKLTLPLRRCGLVHHKLEQLYPTRRGANNFWAILTRAQNARVQDNPGGMGPGARSLSPTR